MEILAFDQNMNRTLQNSIKSVVLHAAKNISNYNSRCKYITDSLKQIYGGVWFSYMFPFAGQSILSISGTHMALRIDGNMYDVFQILTEAQKKQLEIKL